MGVLNPVYQSDYALGADTTVVTTTGTASTDVTAGTLSCMDCIRGVGTGDVSGSKQSVWCSGGWNYEYVNLPMTNSYPVANQDGNAFDATGAENDYSTADKQKKGDLGFCCYTMDVIEA